MSVTPVEPQLATESGPTEPDRAVPGHAGDARAVPAGHPRDPGGGARRGAQRPSSWARSWRWRAGLASTSIGVYGGVLVPGLLLLGVDPRFAAAASLFLQVLVIPIGAGAHYRLGNVTRTIALPLILGGVVGAFIGPVLRVGAAQGRHRAAGLGAHRGRGRAWCWRRSAGVAWAGPAARGRAHGPGRGHRPRGRLLVGHLGRRLGTHRGQDAHPVAPGATDGHRLVAVRPGVHGGGRGRRLSPERHGVRRACGPTTGCWCPLLAGSVAAMVPGAAVLSRLGRERATIAHHAAVHLARAADAHLGLDSAECPNATVGVPCPSTARGSRVLVARRRRLVPGVGVSRGGCVAPSRICHAASRCGRASSRAGQPGWMCHPRTQPTADQPGSATAA